MTKEIAKEIAGGKIEGVAFQLRHFETLEIMKMGVVRRSENGTHQTPHAKSIRIFLPEASDHSSHCSPSRV